MTYEEAKRKARYGRKDWIFWKDRAGETHAEPETADALKRAMLAVGVRGAFTSIAANTGTPYRLTWRIAVLHWRNARRPWDVSPPATQIRPQP